MSSKCMRRMLTEVRQPPRCWSRADWLAASRLGPSYNELMRALLMPSRARSHVSDASAKDRRRQSDGTCRRTRPGMKWRMVSSYDCACLIVEYDVAYEALLRAVIGRLR